MHFHIQTRSSYLFTTRLVVNSNATHSKKVLLCYNRNKMEELQKVGVFIDEIYTVRVEHPNLSSSKIMFKQECFNYIKAFTIFKKFVFSYCNISETFAKDVDKEKLRAIGTQNQLKTAFIQRQNKQQVYQYEIFEQTVELERLKGELQFLQRIETEQHEIINNFFVNQY